MRVSLLQRFFDLVAPRTCCVCGRRLAAEEDTICLCCNLRLPRTNYVDSPQDNEMAKCFWGRVEHLQKAVAMFFHDGGSQVSYPIYRLKYFHQPDLGWALGRLMGRELEGSGFFDDIDIIVPVPLSPDRQRERGYNQSELIAQGMADVCHKPVVPGVMVRQNFVGSQTKKDRWERNQGVKDAFRVVNADKISNCHVLIVDDIVTTGATITACANSMEQVEGVKISVASIAFVSPGI